MISFPTENFQEPSNFVRHSATTGFNTWEEIRSRSVIYSKYFLIGEQVIRLDFSGTHLISGLTSALAHCEIAETSPDFTISIWDHESTGQEAFSIPELKSLALEDLEDQPLAVYRSTGTAGIFDQKGKRAIFWIRSPQYLSNESGSPFRTLFQWWFRQQGWQMIHAAAIAHQGQGVLLVGKGGAGKSTTAFACLRAGLNLLGEDYCLVKGNRLASLYSSGKLTTETLQQFPELKELTEGVPQITLSDRRKQVFFLGNAFRNHFVQEVSLQAIIVPRLGVATGLEKISVAETLRALAPSSLFQTPLSAPRDFQALCELAKKVPCYGLYLERELNRVTDTIRKLLSKGSSDVH